MLNFFDNILEKMVTSVTSCFKRTSSQRGLYYDPLAIRAYRNRNLKGLSRLSNDTMRKLRTNY